MRVRKTEDGKLTPIDTLGPEFSKLLKKLGLKRDRLNFYGLRHTFRTVADAVKDLARLMNYSSRNLKWTAAQPNATLTARYIVRF